MAELFRYADVDIFWMIHHYHLLHMTFLKSIFLHIALILFSVIPDSSSAQQVAYHNYSENFTETTSFGDLQEKPYKSEFFRVRGIPKVTVHTTTGNIEVFQNPDINGVKVDLFLERSFSLWSGRRSLDNFRIILQQQGDRIIASVEDKKSGQVPRDSDIKFHFLVQTPKNVTTNLRAFNGNIFLDDVEGDHFIQNQTGDISISHTKGEIRVVSTTGNIDLANVKGNVYAKTVNGSVNIVSNSGEARVRSVSGDIHASKMRGTLVSATTSGNIYADFTDVSKGIYLETISGDIELFLPETSGFDIEGSAMSYDLRGLRESSITESDQNQRDLNVVIREGGLPVRVSTMSGRIQVSESQK
ncbi:MAG: DUF4097 family beta strand repeat-containing protein [Balneolaceae bacterium]|nr:DUF4097 family beta strand repeat-containing protein [Balneolaceae bacterium]